MSPWGFVPSHELLALAIETPLLGGPPPADRFVAGWSAAWSQFQSDDSGLSSYQGLLGALRADLDAIGGSTIILTNDRALYHMLERFVFDNLMASPRVINSMGRAALAAHRSAA